MDERSQSLVSDTADFDFKEIQDQIAEYRTDLLSTLDQDNTETGGLPHFKQLKLMVGNITQLSQYVLSKTKEQAERILDFKETVSSQERTISAYLNETEN